MSHPIARTLGALAIAAAVMTGSTPAFAATLADSPASYVTEKRVTTLIGLSPALRTSAVGTARSRPNAPALNGGGGTSQSGPSDAELNLFCGRDWFISWNDDANGTPILGTFNLYCAGETIP